MGSSLLSYSFTFATVWIPIQTTAKCGTEPAVLYVTLLYRDRQGSHSFAPIQKSRRSLFPLRKGSLPFLMVDATIGNQAFNHVRCYIFPELSYNKANNTSFYSLEENNVEAQVEFTSKVTERARVTRCWCTEKQFASLCTWICPTLAGRCSML